MLYSVSVSYLTVTNVTQSTVEVERVFSYCRCYYSGTTDGQGALAFKLLHHDESLREGFSETALTSKIGGMFFRRGKMSRHSLHGSYKT